MVEVILYTLLVIIISTTMILSLTEVIKGRLVIEKIREISENSRYANAFIVKNFYVVYNCMDRSFDDWLV